LFIDLEELKKLTVESMKGHVQIMKACAQLNDKDFDEYYKWYESSPFAKGIKELGGLVKRGKNTGSKRLHNPVALQD
jgi:hypothetical protein